MTQYTIDFRKPSKPENPVQPKQGRSKKVTPEPIAGPQVDKLRDLVRARTEWVAKDLLKELDHVRRAAKHFAEHPDCFEYMFQEFIRQGMKDGMTIEQMHNMVQAEWEQELGF
jgi:hypothetical protein